AMHVDARRATGTLEREGHVRPRLRCARGIRRNAPAERDRCFRRARDISRADGEIDVAMETQTRRGIDGLRQPEATEREDVDAGNSPCPPHGNHVGAYAAMTRELLEEVAA